MTKSEAALKILKSPKMLRLEVRKALKRYEDFMKDRLGPGDDFFVRSAFTYNPSIVDDSCARSLNLMDSTPSLQISHGDIFRVTDSLHAGSFTSWLVKIYYLAAY